MVPQPKPTDIGIAPVLEDLGSKATAPAKKKAQTTFDKATTKYQADAKVAQEDFEKAVEAYQATLKEVDGLLEKLGEGNPDVKCNKIPIGEFKSNFVTYLSAEMKGKKFGFSIQHLDNLEWLIIEGK